MQIKDGKKRVELRLLDEKRKKLRVGDQIIFTHTENKDETICARVLGLHSYFKFDWLSWDFPNEILGLDADANLGDVMREYYSDEEVYNYGALAIRFAVEPE